MASPMPEEAPLTRAHRDSFLDAPLELTLVFEIGCFDRGSSLETEECFYFAKAFVRTHLKIRGYHEESKENLVDEN